MSPIKNEYEYFLVLCETLNISEAAEILGIQQAGLSKSLKNLETDRKEQLFYRTNRGLVLTEVGKTLQEKIINLKDSWVEETEKGVHGQIKIGAHPIIAENHLVEIFPKLHEEFPNLDLQLELKRSNEVVKDILNFDLDIGLVANPINHNDLIIKPFKEEFTGLYGNGKKEVLYYNPEMIDLAKSLKKFKSHKLVAVSDYKIMRRMLEESDGKFLLPSSAMKNRRRKAKVLTKVNLCLVYRYDRVKTDSFAEVLERLKISL